MSKRETPSLTARAGWYGLTMAEAVDIIREDVLESERSATSDPR